MKKTIKKIFSILGVLITVLIVVLLAFIIYARVTNSYVSLFGYSVFEIKTGSMEPDLMIGDVILVKSTPVTDLEVGDDITYISKASETNGMIITHRIVEAPVKTDDGRYMLVTRGILEGAVNDAPIYDDQIIGRVSGKIAWLAAFYSFFSTKLGFLVIVFPILLIIGYEFITLVKTVGNKKEKDENEEKHVE